MRFNFWIYLVLKTPKKKVKKLTNAKFIELSFIDMHKIFIKVHITINRIMFKHIILINNLNFKTFNRTLLQMFNRRVSTEYTIALAQR